MTIKRMLITITVILVVIITVLAGINFIKEKKQYDNTEFAVYTSPIIEDLLAAAGNWAVERGATNSALAYSKKVPQDMKDIIMLRRKNADTAYKKALVALNNIQFEGKDNLLNIVQTDYQAIIDFRAQVDKNLNKSKIARKSKIIKKWVPTMSKLVLSSQELRFAVAEIFSSSDTKLATQSQIKHFAWIMNEYAGRERAIIGGTLSANAALNSSKHEKLAKFRGRVEDAWENTLKIVRTNHNPELRQAIDAAKSNYFTDFEKIRQEIYYAGIEGEDYPLSAKEWIVRSTNAIDTLLAIQDASIQETKSYLAHKKQDALMQLTISTGIIAFGILMGLISLYVVMRKVISPLNKMTDAMDILSKGNTDIEIPSLTQKNEIGNMAQCVLVFKDNAIERQRLAEAQKIQQERERQAEIERLEREEFLQQEQKHKLQEQEEHIASEMKQMISACSEGDFSQRMETDGRTGLLLSLSQSMNDICIVVSEGLSDTKSALETMTNGSLNYEMNNTHKGVFKDIADAYAQMREVLKSTISTINTASFEVQITADTVLDSTRNFSQRTEEQAATLEQTAAAMEEVTGVAKGNMNNSQAAAEVSEHSLKAANEGGEVIGKASEAMENIQKASDEISNIILVIDQISAQTNLLALNAAVEAARAGEAGKGFAVVASEVRSLAKRCADASEEIKVLIKATLTQLKTGTDLVTVSGQTIKEIIDAVSQTSDFVKKISSSAKDQMVTLDEINKAVRNLDNMTQNNAALAEENLTVVRSMSKQGNNLVQAMSFFEDSSASAVSQASLIENIGKSGVNDDFNGFGSNALSEDSSASAVSQASLIENIGKSGVNDDFNDFGSDALSEMNHNEATSDDWTEFGGDQDWSDFGSDDNSENAA